MKTLALRQNLPQWLYQLLAWLGILLLLLLLGRAAIRYELPLAWLDSSIWQLFILALLAYFGSLSLSFSLLGYALRLASLPKLMLMVAAFKTLSLLQQLFFYWISFALLFFGFLLSLAAVF